MMKNMGHSEKRGCGTCREFQPSSHFGSVLPTHPPTCHILKEGEGKKAAEGGNPTCDKEQDEQPKRLHVTLPLWRTDAGCLVQDLVFPLNCRKERVRLVRRCPQEPAPGG